MYSLSSKSITPLGNKRFQNKLQDTLGQGEVFIMLKQSTGIAAAGKESVRRGIKCD